MKKILLVFPCQKEELAEDLQLELEDAFSDNGAALVNVSKNIKHAKANITGHKFDLVIININIPEDTKTPIDESAQLGIHLAEWMQNNNLPQNIVVIAPSYSNETSIHINKIENCLLLTETATLIEDVINHAISAKPPEKFVELIFDLSEDNHRWKYQIGLVPRQMDPDCGHITVSQSFVEDLTDLSSDMSNPTSSNWEQKLSRVGTKLRNELFHINGEFGIKLINQLNNVGGLEHSRVKFIVGKDMHPIMLEAIIPPTLNMLETIAPTTPSKYWMLQAPLYRRIRVEGCDQCTIFQGEQRTPINCLVIRSNIDGPVEEFNKDSLPLKLEKLDNVPHECDTLVSFLQNKKKEFNIGEICELGKDDKNPATFENVKNTLNSKPWHLIHYAGHSFYDDESDLGYLFFPDDAGLGLPQKVAIPDFAGYAMNTQFIYLSSCHSTDVQFAFSLASNQIPGVLGYRWDIDDELAMNHAASFYKHLFEERSVERAFLKTRQDMHMEHQDARIWAAPMLILQ